MGGVETDAAVVSATYALCLLPPNKPGDALVEFSVNGQDYISQRELLVFDPINMTNASGPILQISTKDPLFVRALVPYPSELPNISLAFLPTIDQPRQDPYELTAYSARGGALAMPQAIRTLNTTTSFRVVHNGSYFLFRYYEQTMHSVQPAAGRDFA